ncbi:MAG: hypothetical protein FWG09_07830 [Synergistaceae bacterium]|nr:hypothetical protein [Synergistaceae bacterium]
MKKIILLLLIAFIFDGPAGATQYYGSPMYCRTQIEYREKEPVMRQIIKDMSEEGYVLKQKSAISLLFETSLRSPNRFNYATAFGLNWFPLNKYGWKREEFSPPVYQLSVTVVKKTKTSVEVEITPIIIWNPGNAYQEEIYEYYAKTKRALNDYLSSLKEMLDNTQEKGVL